MASGNQLDRQREERWPQQTQTSAELGSSVKVTHNPYEEDSDYSELEGAATRLVDISPEEYAALKPKAEDDEHEKLW